MASACGKAGGDEEHVQTFGGERLFGNVHFEDQEENRRLMLRIMMGR
jgi:hypothetical protein